MIFWQEKKVNDMNVKNAVLLWSLKTPVTATNPAS